MKELKCPNCQKTFQVDDASYASIVKQVRDSEFSKDIKDKEEQFESDKIKAVQIAKMETEKKFNEILNKKETEILKLKSEIIEEKSIAKNSINELTINKDMEIVALKNKLESFDKDKKLEIHDLISKKDAEISKLKSEKEIDNKEFQLQEQCLRKEYEREIEQLRDFRAKQSVKILGESLEQHCKIAFEQSRALGFNRAYFEKDNDIAQGSKGDFIFRDYDEDGNEYISIMFDMKNESDTSSNKKKNEDFLEKLDKDRKQKKCEYAVLVSMLEQDNELYNTGIVDVSYKYEKMYVVRPSFFIPIITLLRNAAMNTIQYKKELNSIKMQNIDISNFEDELNFFKEKFAKNCIVSSKKFQTAIAEIDKAIKELEKVKENLISSDKNLQLANNKLEDLTIKKLTKNNPTMKAKFKALEDKKDSKK